MPRPPGLPSFDTVGARVVWWRRHRKMTQSKLAHEAGVPQGTLGDLERERSKTSRYLNRIAAALALNPHYLETDEGEPELGAPQPPPPKGDAWPFSTVPHTRLSRLNRVEMSFVEQKVQEALDIIDEERRKPKRG